MNTRKEKFINDFRMLSKVTHMVIAVRLSSGAIELIINSENIQDKFQY
jgi:hypothetical protein